MPSDTNNLSLMKKIFCYCILFSVITMLIGGFIIKHSMGTKIFTEEVLLKTQTQVETGVPIYIITTARQILDVSPYQYASATIGKSFSYQDEYMENQRLGNIGGGIVFFSLISLIISFFAYLYFLDKEK